jgi:hypothetical protein
MIANLQNYYNTKIVMAILVAITALIRFNLPYFLILEAKRIFFARIDARKNACHKVGVFVVGLERRQVIFGEIEIFRKFGM